MKTVLITGARGFIGSNCASYLCSQYRVLTPTHADLDIRNSDAVKAYFATHDIDYIIHCATVGGVRGVIDSPSTVDENLAMVDNILRHKNNNAYMITFGSGAMYGRHRPLCKVSEEEIGIILPEDLYGLSKVRIAERIRMRDDTCCLIIFACYGYGEKESRFPTYAIQQHIYDKAIHIQRNVIFDYLFVEDMQAIVARCMRTPPAVSLMNITPSQSISLLELAHCVNHVGGRNVDIHIEHPTLQNQYTGDNSILRTTFPDIALTDYTTGIAKFYTYLSNKISLSNTME